MTITFTKPARQYGAHRRPQAGLLFKDFYEAHTGRDWVSLAAHRAAKQIADAITVKLPVILLADVDERRAELADLGGVHVTIDPAFEVEECTWGDHDEPVLASVQVYGSEVTREEITAPLELVKACQRCAIAPDGPVKLAKSQTATDKDIRVEVCE